MRRGEIQLGRKLNLILPGNLDDVFVSADPPTLLKMSEASQAMAEPQVTLRVVTQ